MSTDTAKQNEARVDSRVFEWKNDIGNSNEAGNSSFRANEDGYRSVAEEARHSVDRVGNSTVNRKSKLYSTRYFIIKSLNHQNIQLSVEKGIWATQVMNEPILDEAFNNSGKVILIFSVNMSGFFQGYAQMMSSVGWRRDNLWSQGRGKSNPWGRSFKVKWLRLSDLPFQKTLHLKNPLNDHKPVKISRDCQELQEDIGEALCELLDENYGGDGMLNSNFHRDGFPLKRRFTDPPCSLRDGEYNASPVQMSWTTTPLQHPSFLYHNQAEANRYPLANPKSTGLHMQFSSGSPLASTLTEDDFLEMAFTSNIGEAPLWINVTQYSYEEYLEAHSRRVNQLCLPETGPSLTRQAASKSKRHDDDKNSSFTADQSRPHGTSSRPHKKSRHSSNKCNSPLRK
ncbi:YTH domain-containing protein 1 isoform X3 [Tripterygium wilfordii]|uniref:YTH domain-containing protein 1 isoform X3 n=1 Tax=Tripterygium wilfordii TaxID=458696 RepID=UPI0018F8639A|nr:YTH domain-containing protein 1 isoform X3 [Tripterygium wilfordii]